MTELELLPSEKLNNQPSKKTDDEPSEYETKYVKANLDNDLEFHEVFEPDNKIDINELFNAIREEDNNVKLYIKSDNVDDDESKRDEKTQTNDYKTEQKGEDKAENGDVDEETEKKKDKNGDKKDDDDQSDNKSKDKGDLDPKNVPVKENKDKEEDILKQQLSVLSKKLDSVSTQFPSAYKKYYSMYSKESAKSGTFDKIDPKLITSRTNTLEREKLKGIYKLPLERKPSRKPGTEAEPQLHRVYKLDNYAHKDYYEISKSFVKIGKILNKSKFSFYVLNVKLVKLKAKLSKTIKNYRVVAVTYNIDSLKETVANLDKAMDKICNALANVKSAYTHVLSSLSTLHTIKGNFLLKVNYIRRKILSTIVQHLRISMEGHIYSKQLIKNLIYTIQKEYEKIVNLSSDSQYKSLKHHKLCKMKKTMKTLIKITIEVSLQVLKCQNRFNEFDSITSTHLSKADEAKIKLLQLCNEDTLGELDLNNLRYDEQNSSTSVSCTNIYGRFGMERSDLMTHLDEFSKQLYDQIKVMYKKKRFVTISKFFIFNYASFLITSCVSDTVSFSNAHTGMTIAIKYIKASYILINKCKIMLNLIISNDLGSSVVQQLAFCIGAFIREALANQLFSRQEILLSYKDLENAYEKINTSIGEDSDIKPIDTKNELKKVYDIIDESNRSLIEGFALAEWVGINQILFEKDKIEVNYTTLAAILSREFGFKL